MVAGVNAFGGYVPGAVRWGVTATGSAKVVRSGKRKMFVLLSRAFTANEADGAIKRTDPPTEVRSAYTGAATRHTKQANVCEIRFMCSILLSSCVVSRLCNQISILAGDFHF